MNRKWKSNREFLVHQKSEYECFRSRALVVHTGLTVGKMRASVMSHTGSSRLCIDSGSQHSTPSSKLSVSISSENDQLEGINNGSLCPEVSPSSLTAFQLLERAVHTAVVTNHFVRLLNDENLNDTDLHDSLVEVHKTDYSQCEPKHNEKALVSLVDENRRTETENFPIRSRFSDMTHSRNAGEFTILAFVNSTSGGHMGKSLLKTLQSFLGPSYVIDLSTCADGNMPEDTLIHYATDPMTRVLVCGGDGTCGWIYSSLDKVWANFLGTSSSASQLHLSKYRDHLPLAIMPLGTGNDLSRQFGWGGGFECHMEKRSMILSVQKAPVKKIDRWRCIIMPLNNLSEEELSFIPKMLDKNNSKTMQTLVENLKTLVEDNPNPISHTTRELISEKLSMSSDDKSINIFDGVFCNYFSLGFDATIAYLFHIERENYPEKFTSPLKNKIVYLRKSQAAIKAPRLKNRVNILVNDKDGSLINLKIPKSCRAVIIMNIQSYGGGHQLAKEGSPTDGLIDVIFVSNLIRTATSVGIGHVLPFLLFTVASQTNRVCIRTKCPLHCQVDGEPWLQGEGIIHLKFHSRNAILEKVEETVNCGCIGINQHSETVR